MGGVEGRAGGSGGDAGAAVRAGAGARCACGWFRFVGGSLALAGLGWRWSRAPIASCGGALSFLFRCGNDGSARRFGRADGVRGGLAGRLGTLGGGAWGRSVGRPRGTPAAHGRNPREMAANARFSAWRLSSVVLHLLVSLAPPWDVTRHGF